MSSRKPETVFYTSVNKHLPQGVYQMKISNPYLGGPPDHYYEANPGMMWVEWKFLRPMPKTVFPRKQLSALQYDWLTRAHTNGRNVAVIVGSDHGGVVFRFPELTTPITREEFLQRAMSRQEIAAWIATQVTATQKSRRT